MTGQPTLLDRVVAGRGRVIIVLSIGIALAAGRHLTVDNDWQFFSWGGKLLFGEPGPFVRASYRVDPLLPGGLHLYANYPFVQIGPPALVLGWLLQHTPGDGIVAAGIVIQLLGLLYVFMVDRAFVQRTPGHDRRLAALLGGSMVTIVWGMLTRYRHLDDALTLAGLAVASWLILHERWLAVGCVLGLAAATKPWGLPLLALALVAPGWRQRGMSAAGAICTAALLWAPFVLADRHTLEIGQITLQLSPASAVAALGVDALTHDQAIRLLQFGLGLLVAAVVVANGKWPLAPLAAFSIRLLLEPSAYSYYAAAIVAAAFLADIGSFRARLPLLTIIATGAWMVTESASPETAAQMRLLEYATLFAVCVVYSFYRRTPGAINGAVPYGRPARPTPDPPVAG